MNARVVAVVAALGLLAGCTSRSGDPEPKPTEEAPSAAAERDEMLVEADRIVTVLTTVDAADIEGSLDEWESVVTGDLLTEFETGRDDAVEAFTAAGTSADSEVLATAASTFDRANGTAEVLAVVQVTSTKPGEEPADTWRRMRLGVRMTDDGWKADSVATVPVGG